MIGAINLGAQGIAGWHILQRTEERQMQIVAKDSLVQRELGYFRDRIEVTTSAEDLAGDYRMLRVALGAFGLEDDIPNRAFIKKVLESDLQDNKSLANRLSDKRYLQLAQAFDFNEGGPGDDADFATRISQAYLEREFERRIGANDEGLRLAMTARRDLTAIADRESSDRTLWFEALANPPFRKVLEGAFGFGSAYGKLPVDRQVDEFMKAAERNFSTSSLKDLAQPEQQDRLIQRFLVRSSLTVTKEQNKFASALTLLGGTFVNT